MIMKVLSWALKAEAIVVAFAVAFAGVLMAIGGTDQDVGFGLAIAAGALGAMVGVVRSKTRDKLWRSYALLAAVTVLLFGAVLPSARRIPEKDARVVRASVGFGEFRDKTWVTGTGTVTRVLADDRTPPCHQRFILSDDAGCTILIAHNIDEWKRLAGVKVGDAVAFKGEYVSSPEGGVVHWTHPDKSHRKPGGWLKKVKGGE